METPIIKKIIFKKSKTHGHQLMSNFPLMRDVKNNIYDLSIQPSLTRWTQVTQGQTMKALDCNHKKIPHVILFLSSQEYKLHPLFFFSFPTLGKTTFLLPCKTKTKNFAILSSSSSSRHPSFLKVKQIPRFCFLFFVFLFTLQPPFVSCFPLFLIPKWPAPLSSFLLAFKARQGSLHVAIY